MEIVFLGTSGMQPTKDRGLMSIYINHGAENILVDCGEGTQRQMRIADLKPTKIQRIFLTHLHTDHILGILGMFYNLEANQYPGVIEVYGPRGLKKMLSGIVREEFFKGKLRVKLNEIKEGTIYEGKELIATAVKLEHCVLCYGYSFEEREKRKMDLKYLAKFGLKQDPVLGKLQKGEDIIWKGKKIKARLATKVVKGKKLSVVLDTIYCKNAVKLASNSDLLISESTFMDKDADKAKEYMHLTSSDAGRIAKESGAKKLILTHFSQRYKDTKDMLSEAKKVFKNTSVSEDFMKVSV